MNLKTVHVKDLPLSSNVAYAKDIQSYVQGMLSDVARMEDIQTYVSNALSGMSFSMDGLLGLELKNALILLARQIGNIIQKFGGSFEDNTEPEQTT